MHTFRQLGLTLGLAGVLAGHQALAVDALGDTGDPTVQINVQGTSPRSPPDLSALTDYEGPVVFLVYGSRATTGIAQRRADMIRDLFDFADGSKQLATTSDGQLIRYGFLDIQDMVDDGWGIHQAFTYVRDTLGFSEENNGPFTLVYGPGAELLADREIDRLIGAPDNPGAMSAWQKKMTAWIGSRLVNPDNSTVYCFTNCDPVPGKKVVRLPH